jgi:hypothetical protein
MEDDVTRDDDAVCGEVKASVPLVIRGVAEKDTPRGARSELMWGNGREVGVAGKPEDPKVGVGGSGTEESEVGEGIEMALLGSMLRK